MTPCFYKKHSLNTGFFCLRCTYIVVEIADTYYIHYILVDLLYLKIIEISFFSFH